MPSDATRQAMRLLRDIAGSSGGDPDGTNSDYGRERSPMPDRVQSGEVTRRMIDVAAFELLLDDSVTDDQALEGLMRDAIHD